MAAGHQRTAEGDEPATGGGHDSPFLICFDGSEPAGRAIRGAGEITGGGRALVVHAWLPPSALMLQGRALKPSHPLAAAVEEFDASARDTAERVAAEGAAIAVQAGFDAQPVAIEAPDGVWRPIVKLAQERAARAVVVGSHGRSPVRSALLGSVAHGIVNHCRRPVIVVPP